MSSKKNKASDVNQKQATAEQSKADIKAKQVYNSVQDKKQPVEKQTSANFIDTPETPDKDKVKNKEHQHLQPNSDQADNLNSTTESKSETKTEKIDSAEEQDFKKLFEQKEQEAAQNWDSLLRLKAEMENARKRAEREIQNARSFGLEKFVNSLLPVIDSLDMAIETQSNLEVKESPNIASIHEGMLMIQKMFIDALAKANVERINPLGEVFDSNLHEALTMQVDQTKPVNTVLNVVQVGYSLNGRLLRAARVIVSKQE